MEFVFRIIYHLSKVVETSITVTQTIMLNHR